MKNVLRLNAVLAVAVCLAGMPARAPGIAHADSSVQTLPFAQDWSTTTLITASNDWSGVPGIVGYRGDALSSADGAEPM